MITHFEKHITISTPAEIMLDHLAKHTDLSRQKLKKTMQNGAVWLESTRGISRVRRAKKIPAQQDILHLYYDEAIQRATPSPATLIADESAYSIWDKPGGMFSQGTKWGDHNTVYRWAEQYLTPQRPAFPVHRLDRAASGLIILAHTKTVATAFSTLFQQRRISKHYHAYIEGELTLPSLPYTINTPLDDKTAITEIINMQADNKNQQTLLTLSIKTGRKHQIRRHLSGLNHPIIGDRLYGSTRTDKNLQLRAVFLGFYCPITEKLKQYQLT